MRGCLGGGLLPSGATSPGTKPGRGVARLNQCTMPPTPLKPAWEADLLMPNSASKFEAGRNVAWRWAAACGTKAMLPEPATLSSSSNSPGGGAKLGVAPPLVAPPLVNAPCELGTGLIDLVRHGVALSQARGAERSGAVRGVLRLSSVQVTLPWDCCGYH